MLFQFLKSSNWFNRKKCFIKSKRSLTRAPFFIYKRIQICLSIKTTKADWIFSLVILRVPLPSYRHSEMIHHAPFELFHLKKNLVQTSPLNAKPLLITALTFYAYLAHLFLIFQLRFLK